MKVKKGGNIEKMPMEWGFLRTFGASGAEEQVAPVVA